MKAFLSTAKCKLKTLKSKAKQLPLLLPLNYDKVSGEIRCHPDSHGRDVVKVIVTIHNLPPEIIAECFHWYIISIHRAHLSLQRHQSEDSTPDIPSPYSWITIRHVNRWWREIALTFPVLSTYICITSLECVQDMLSRAGELPIHVYESAGPAVLERREPRTLVLAHLTRIASLQLQCLDPTPPTGRTTLRAIMLRLMQTQHMLEMWGTPEHSGSAAPHEYSHLADFSCSFGELAMVGCAERILGANLRRIYLNRSVHPSTQSLRCFMGTLNRLELLEELVLDHPFHVELPSQTTPRWPIDTSSLPRVSLPHLKSLRLEDEDYITAYIVVERLIFPNTASVSFEFPSISDDTVLHAAGVFVACLDNAQPVTDQSDSEPQSVSIARRSATDIELLFWRDRLSLHDLREQRKTGEGACFAFRCPSVDSAFARALLAHAPLHGVTTALLTEHVSSGSFPWNSVLCSLTSVDELGLEYEAHEEIEEPSLRSPSGLPIVYSPLTAVQHAHVWLHRPSAVPPGLDRHQTSMLHNAAQTLSSQPEVLYHKVDLPRTGDADLSSKDRSDVDVDLDIPIPSLGSAAPSGSGRPQGGLRGWLASNIPEMRKRSESKSSQ